MCTPSKDKIQFWHFALLVLKTEFCSEHILRLFGLFSDREPYGRRGTTVTKPFSRSFMFAAVPFKCLTFKRLIQCESLSVTAELQTRFTGFSFAVVLCKCHVQGELQILSPRRRRNPHVFSSQPCWEWCCFPQVRCPPLLFRAGRPWWSARPRQQLQRETQEPLSVWNPELPSAPSRGTHSTRGHFCNMRHFPCPALQRLRLSCVKLRAVVNTNYKGNAAAPARALPLHRNWGHLPASIKQEGLLGIRVTSSWFPRKAAEQVSFCFSTEEASKIPWII